MGLACEETLTIDPFFPSEIIFPVTICVTFITCLTLALNKLKHFNQSLLRHAVIITDLYPLEVLQEKACR